MKSLKPDDWQKGGPQQEFESETNSKDEEKSKVYYFFWGLVVSIACLKLATSLGGGLHYFIYGSGYFPLDSYFMAIIFNTIVVTRWMEFVEKGSFSDTNDSMESRTINPGDPMHGIGGDDWK
uniref:Uncharacterized protein n=1 Tax=Hydrogenovibrio crunogenus (strain DSM 25203 / XCL-2) TaxID=317025 RepID=Q31FQ6_HYDCU